MKSPVKDLKFYPRKIKEVMNLNWIEYDTGCILQIKFQSTQSIVKNCSYSPSKTKEASLLWAPSVLQELLGKEKHRKTTYDSDLMGQGIKIVFCLISNGFPVIGNPFLIKEFPMAIFIWIKFIIRSPHVSLIGILIRTHFCPSRSLLFVRGFTI